MELYIKLENGQIIGHPVLLENLLQVYNTVPENYVKFERVSCPKPAVYKINQGVTYQLINGVATDVWHIRDMTQEEKTNFQNQVKLEWTENNGYASWIFNEDLCMFEAPVPKPEKYDNVVYEWDESQLNWAAVILPTE